MTTGPGWQNTVLIINRDEWGGFFDTVVPPRVIAANDVDTDLVNGNALLGCRVPTVCGITIQRGHTGYTRGSTPQLYDHTSVLKLIEWRYNLPPLTPRDASNQIANLALALNFQAAYTPPPVLPKVSRQSQRFAAFSSWEARSITKVMTSSSYCYPILFQAGRRWGCRSYAPADGKQSLLVVVIGVVGCDAKLFIRLVQQLLGFGCVPVHIKLIGLLGLRDAFEGLCRQPLRSCQIWVPLSGKVLLAGSWAMAKPPANMAALSAPPRTKFFLVICVS